MDLKNKKKLITLLTGFLLIGGLVSCNGKNSPDYMTVLTVSPTEDISPYFTQAAETVFAQITETAKAQPTATSTPTTTTTPTGTPTPTASATAKPVYGYVWVAPTTVLISSTPLSLTPSISATASSNSCTIVSQSVANGAEFAAGTDFDATWTIKNTGTSAWDMSDIDYRYVSGTAMHSSGSAFDFPTSVTPGGSITLTVDMVAPSSPAYYETFWGIFRSSVNFCTLPVKINVK